MGRKNEIIKVEGIPITVVKHGDDDYVSLTDMAGYRNSTAARIRIGNWMRAYITIEYLGLWKILCNDNFSRLEFEIFKNNSGANSFYLMPSQWIEKTNAIGIISKAAP